MGRACRFQAEGAIHGLSITWLQFHVRCFQGDDKSKACEWEPFRKANNSHIQQSLFQGSLFPVCTVPQLPVCLPTGWPCGRGASLKKQPGLCHSQGQGWDQFVLHVISGVWAPNSPFFGLVKGRPKESCILLTPVFLSLVCHHHENSVYWFHSCADSTPLRPVRLLPQGPRAALCGELQLELRQGVPFAVWFTVTGECFLPPKGTLRIPFKR